MSGEMVYFHAKFNQLSKELHYLLSEHQESVSDGGRVLSPYLQALHQILGLIDMKRDLQIIPADVEIENREWTFALLSSQSYNELAAWKKGEEGHEFDEKALQEIITAIGVCKLVLKHLKIDPSTVGIFNN